MGLNIVPKAPIIQPIGKKIIRPGGYAEPICFPDCDTVSQVANSK